MSRRVSIERAAREELAAAMEWYEERRPGLGEELLDSVDEAIIRLLENPGISFPIPGCPPGFPARRMLVKRFPYAVVFMESADEVRIIAVSHMKRRPGYWISRT